MESLQKAQTKVSAEYGEHPIHVGKIRCSVSSLEGWWKDLKYCFRLEMRHECCAGDRIPDLDGLSNDIQWFPQGCSHFRRPHRCRWLNFWHYVRFQCLWKRYLKTYAMIDAARAIENKNSSAHCTHLCSGAQVLVPDREPFDHGKIVRTFISW